MKDTNRCNRGKGFCCKYVLLKKWNTILSFFVSQLLKSRSDGEFGHTASCTHISCDATPPHSSGVPHERNASTKVSSSVSHRSYQVKSFNSFTVWLFLRPPQDLQLLLRELSDPSDMDPRKQLALQSKGSLISRSHVVDLSSCLVSPGMPASHLDRLKCREENYLYLLL